MWSKIGPVPNEAVWPFCLTQLNVSLNDCVQLDIPFSKLTLKNQLRLGLSQHTFVYTNAIFTHFHFLFPTLSSSLISFSLSFFISPPPPPPPPMTGSYVYILLLIQDTLCCGRCTEIKVRSSFLSFPSLPFRSFPSLSFPFPSLQISSSPLPPIFYPSLFSSPPPPLLLLSCTLFL